MGMPKSDIGTQFLDAETLSNILVWAKATPKTQWEFQTLLSPMWPAYTGAASTSKLLASQMGDLISALLSVEPTPLQKYVLQKYLKNYRSLKPRQVTRVFWMLPNESQNHIMTQYLGRDAYWNIDQQTVFKRMVGVDFKHETPLPFSKHDIKRFNDLRELDPENAEVIAKIFQYSGTDQLETLLGYPPELYGIREQKHFENHNWRTTTGS
ncbi:hypothetical protein FRB96_008523 [Tulasnella sp. 330]|nr:hypothetical protein FRB96_008523 [Tulasnella sp. 330]